jgi:isopentenyl diphosphate isomerase/L-lactate dehydrogenase-like FMN-dependent dehydrogenase
MGDLPYWFQLYWCRDFDFAASLLERAEAAGYGAIVLTVDVPYLAWREPDLENGFLPFRHGHGLGNFVSDPVFCSRLDAPPEDDLKGAMKQFGQIFGNPSLTWDDLAWLREHTSLPILLKGILTPDDARRAIDHGVSGVVVSNHGGRQIDGSIGALDALPAVVEAVAGQAEVLFDSGVRRGSDVLKAVALGASAALVGRPYLYGLVLDGATGAREVLLNLLADMDLTLGQMGCRNFAELDVQCVRRIEPISPA